MPVTFSPASHQANPIQDLEELNITPLSILRDACEDQHDKVDEFLQSSFRGDYSETPILPKSNGLFYALSDAYNKHLAISIRPDDVWTTILTQFSFFVNANAERLRNHFVAHDGQRHLVVVGFGSRHTVDFGFLARVMTEKLEENVTDPMIRDWILPNFTTTTLNDTVVSSVVMMATMKKYFTYEFQLRCGIPRVTLEGEREDWEKLLARVEKLTEYGEETTRWYSLLRPVLSRFVKAFDAPDSPENLEFWNNVAHYIRGGSGPSYFSGWISAFCVFDADGQWIGHPPGGVPKDHDKSVVLDGVYYHRLKTTSIPCAYAAVDVHLDDNGQHFETIMVAGMVGYLLDNSADLTLSDTGKSDLLRPVPGWWIFTNKAVEENEK